MTAEVCSCTFRLFKQIGTVLERQSPSKIGHPIHRKPAKVVKMRSIETWSTQSISRWSHVSIRRGHEIKLVVVFSGSRVREDLTMENL